MTIPPTSGASGIGGISEEPTQGPSSGPGATGAKQTDPPPEPEHQPMFPDIYKLCIKQRGPVEGKKMYFSFEKNFVMMVFMQGSNASRASLERQKQENRRANR